jgi:cell division protein FtsQ
VALFGKGKGKRGATAPRRHRDQRNSEQQQARRLKAERAQKLEQRQQAQRKQRADQLKAERAAQRAARGSKPAPQGGGLFGWLRRGEPTPACSAQQARTPQRRVPRGQESQRREPQRREASRAAPQPKQQPRQPLPWRRWLDGAVPLAALALVGGLVAGGWWMLHHVGSVPVSRVLFTGNLQHVDRAELVERVQPLLVGEGFMTADLGRIRATLLELPWVAEISVRRRWPSQLVVAVKEQEPIARWGEDGLLNRHGQVFRPEALGEVATLPLLFGPDDLAADVVARYAELSQLLTAQGLRLASLGTDRRGSWSADLQGGVNLRIGTGDALTKLRRFVRVYRSGLEQEFAQVAYIDLRYSNGLAVGWQQ